MTFTEPLRQLRAPGPDHPDANTAGCSCPYTGNNKGAGSLKEGVREWTVNPRCPIHSDPQWWRKA